MRDPRSGMRGRDLDRGIRDPGCGIRHPGTGPVVPLMVAEKYIPQRVRTLRKIKPAPCGAADSGIVVRTLREGFPHTADRVPQAAGWTPHTAEGTSAVCGKLNPHRAEPQTAGKLSAQCGKVFRIQRIGSRRQRDGLRIQRERYPQFAESTMTNFSSTQASF